MKNLFKFKKMLFVTYRNRKHALVLSFYPDEEFFCSPIVIEFIPDENDSEEVIQQKLQAYIQACYDRQKKLYESSENYAGHVKNGTYERSIDFLFPDEGKTITIRLVMQRYKNKQTKETRSFYGGMVVPRVSLLTGQAITMLIEMEYSNCSYQKGHDESMPLKDFRESWGISVKTYWTLVRMANEWFEAFKVSKGIIFELTELLQRIRFCVDLENVLLRFPGFLC